MFKFKAHLHFKNKNMPEITTEIFANVIEPRKVREHSSCFATLSTLIENECFFSKAHDEAKLVIFGN